MKAEIRTVIQDTAAASLAGGINFGDVVGRLMAVGVERYHVDFVRGDTIYYVPDGVAEIVARHDGGDVPAEVFSADGVRAAVRGAQAGILKYPEFCRLALAAGCAGYIVSMVGRRVVYYGRTGDTHVEWFPGAT